MKLEKPLILSFLLSPHHLTQLTTEVHALVCRVKGEGVTPPWPAPPLPPAPLTRAVAPHTYHTKHNHTMVVNTTTHYGTPHAQWALNTSHLTILYRHSNPLYLYMKKCAKDFCTLQYCVCHRDRGMLEGVALTMDPRMQWIRDTLSAV